jgi:outer membrane protein assembly factor BamE (lipoprotein component of BamABCDE complex)
MEGIVKLITLFTLFLSLTILSGCMTASQHKQQVEDDSADKLTVGTVQKEVKAGMSGADIIGILGSPNIVSTDAERREVWVYDKIATNFVYSSDSGGVNSLILGFGSDVLVGGGGGYSKSAGAASRSQRTLTIIIKFGHDSLVRDYAYHSSSF